MAASDETHQPLTVLIVGAGIAGLTAAIALGRQGHQVVILEKSRFNRETGAAIHLPPNCTALLQELDIDPRDFGGTLSQEMHRYSHDGVLIHRQGFADIRHTWQAEWYLVHRVDLHNHLKQRALETATLHTSCKIVNVDLTGARPSITLGNGDVFSCDLLLGADGLHSIVRKEIAPDASDPYPVGKSCFRWLLRTEDLRRVNATREIVSEPGVFIEWNGSGRRLVAYPCSNNEVLNLCAFLPTSEAGDLGEGWQALGNKAAMLNAFESFCPAVQEVAARAEDDLKVWQLFDMESLPRWVKGSAALLGDAAHPFQPYMGQGGAMAIEDAVALATLLPSGTAVHEIPRRLSLYEEARRPRVDLVLEYTRLNGRDEDDTSQRRITGEEMMGFLRTCFSHNEIRHSTALLQSLNKQGSNEVN